METQNKTTISISEEYARRLRDIKNYIKTEDGRKMTSMDDVMHYLMGSEESNYTQETPCKTLHDSQEAIRANSSSGVSSNST